MELAMPIVILQLPNVKQKNDSKKMIKKRYTSEEMSKLPGRDLPMLR
jgi:hypothetical protein